MTKQLFPIFVLLLLAKERPNHRAFVGNFFLGHGGIVVVVVSGDGGDSKRGSCNMFCSSVITMVVAFDVAVILYVVGDGRRSSIVGEFSSVGSTSGMVKISPGFDCISLEEAMIGLMEMKHNVSEVWPSFVLFDHLVLNLQAVSW